jgi:hypothetical protein
MSPADTPASMQRRTGAGSSSAQRASVHKAAVPAMTNATTAGVTHPQRPMAQTSPTAVVHRRDADHGAHVVVLRLVVLYVPFAFITSPTSGSQVDASP